MAKYLDPRADLTFKKVFGEHKNLVISLLNAMLPLADDERVESIEYWPTEKIPQRTQLEKDSIVDVCCRDNKQREFIVEMQMTWTESFKKRVLFNASKAYVAQSESGGDYNLLQPVYALNFVNAPMNIDADGYYHHYQLVHHLNSEEVIKGLQLVFIELPKFNPQTWTEKKMQVLWLRFLTEINSKIMNAPVELMEDPEVSQALKIVEIAAYTPSEMYAYEKFWDTISVQKTLENARKREMEAAMQEKEAAMQEKEKVKEELEQVKAEIQQTKVEKEELKAEIQQTKAEKEELKAEIQQTKAEKEELKAEMEFMKAELKQKDIDIALRMKDRGYTSADIAELTGLPVDAIDGLPPAP